MQTWPQYVAKHMNYHTQTIDFSQVKLVSQARNSRRKILESELSNNTAKNNQLFRLN